MVLSCSLAENRLPPASSVMTPLICCQALSARLLVERLKQPEPKCSQMCVSPDGWSQLGVGGGGGLEEVEGGITDQKNSPCLSRAAGSNDVNRA